MTSRLMLKGAQKTRMARLAFRRAPRTGSCLLFAGSPYMPRRLKVFRTTIGFHDAYVAAPSRKAALSAWGTTKDLFASEAAEEVTEPTLIAEVLARPGEVIRKARGALALPNKPGQGTAAPAKRRRPEPSRSALAAAEATLKAFEHRSAEELASLEAKQAELARQHSELQARHHAERAKLEQRRSTEARKYAARLEEWQSS